MFVIMGVAGCGKSSIGNGVADRMGGIYLEGDSFHPKSNIEKMSGGIPLSDEDRWPWLTIVSETMAVTDGLVFAGCSALKRSYRDHIRNHAGETVCFIHLNGSRELIASRMSSREGHFMPDSLLDSQFATLEIPAPDELAISIDIGNPPEVIINEICRHINSMR